jgi:NADH dehydrogenase (ubiquinone) 1 alpha subcomplex subunit 5
MRRTLRLFAGVKPVRYLEAGNPTGLAGLATHPTPRSTLLYLYASTLEKLKTVPEHSLYRQSVEALTKQRMALVESMVPPGYEEWAVTARERIAKHPEQFQIAGRGPNEPNATPVVRNGAQFLISRLPRTMDPRFEEWDSEADEGPTLEGSRSEEERKDQGLNAERTPILESEKVQWDPEPQLTADQCVER